MLSIHKVSPAETAPIAAIAAEIWREHYVPIIGAEQVEYMLENFQSADAISSQIEEGMDYYSVFVDSTLAGYFALSQMPDKSLFISKFYLSNEFRGRGLGRSILTDIEHRARQCNAKRVWLTVNKYNPALKAYLALGFERTKDIVTDIGNGYVMDDYQMEKKLTGSPPK